MYYSGAIAIGAIVIGVIIDAVHFNHWRHWCSRHLRHADWRHYHHNIAPMVQVIAIVKCHTEDVSPMALCV